MEAAEYVSWKIDDSKGLNILHKILGLDVFLPDLSAVLLVYLVPLACHLLGEQPEIRN